MTALRQRLIEDMQVRNYSPRTVEAYVAAVAKLAKHFRRSPDQLSGEDIRVFQVHWLAQKVSWSQFNQIVSGLRFFFGTTLARPSTCCRWVHKESALRPVEQPASRSIADTS
jgi:integrase/recombinase XerD